MWPFDYFNQFSAIEIDEKIGSNTIVFHSRWFGRNEGDAKDIASCNNRKKWIEQTISSLEIKDRKFNYIDSEEQGDIFERIQQNIIKATFVICDLTWIAKQKKICPNVLLELGLAMAWKMEEQVICIWDKNICSFDRNLLPSDIPLVYVKEINSSKESEFKSELKDFIVKRYNKFSYSKDLLIKNTKSKLDRSSLQFLSSLRGLLFVDSIIDVIHTSTIRHLLNLGVIANFIFQNNMSFGYYLTGLGRMILEKEFKVPLYPNVLADMLVVRYCREPINHFESKREEFEKFYDIDYMQSLKGFNELIPSEISNRFRTIILSNPEAKEFSDEVSLDLFGRFVESPQFFVLITQNIYPQWNQKRIGGEFKKNE